MEWWWGMYTRIKWTLATGLAPKYYTGTALQKFIDAKRFLRDLERLRKNQHPTRGWTLAYACFANMGGFSISVQGIEIDRPPLVVLIGETLVALLPGQPIVLGEAVQSLGTSLPTEADVLDRSKSDRFAKSITLLQVLYLCINCFVRLGRHLPITLLELGTLGFAACSFVSYGVLFNEPHAVNITALGSPSIPHLG